MATSGSMYTNVGRNFQLRLEWSSNTDEANNRSTVTARLYWLDRTGYGYNNSSATKTCAMRANGGSWNTRSAAGMAGLSTNQKKQIQSWTFNINHASDGEGSLSLAAYFDVNSTLEGSYVGRINIGTKTWSLPTIPRASTLSSSPDWTAGSNKTFSISRASTSFNHDLVIQVKDSGGTWRGIKTLDYSRSDSSKSSSFSTGENTNIFKQIAGRNSSDTRLILKTFSGSSLIGEKYYYGTVTAPAASEVSSMTGKARNEHDFWVGDTVGATLSVRNSGFTHSIRISTVGNFTRLWNDVGSSFSWTPSASEKQTIYNDAANETILSASIGVTTYYNGERVRSTIYKNMWFYVKDSNPTFGTGFSYLDVNPITLPITGNNQYIIQEKSTMRVDIPAVAKAVAVNGATMKYYDITVNGDTQRATYKDYETVSVTFTEITASSNTSLAIKAVDSRGLSTTRSVPVQIVPYSLPTVNFTAPRVNNFETDTMIKVNGKLSPLAVNGTNKNSLLNVRYRYREKGVGSFSTYKAFNYSGFPNYTVTTIVLPLDNQKAWEVEVEVSDKLGVRSVIRVVDVGKPILFIDPGLKSVGFGDYPTGPNEVKINGRIVFGSTMWSTSGQGEGQGAMFLNNSDMTGLNGLFFNDIANNKGEGLMWPKTGVTPDPANASTFDQQRVLDGTGYLNDNVIYTARQGLEEIWSGAYFMNDEQTITPSRPLLDCPNGWMMVWSNYENGAPANSFWNFIYVPKRYSTLSNGGMMQVLGGSENAAVATSVPILKYIYVNNTTITGHRDNSVGVKRAAVLRFVYTW